MTLPKPMAALCRQRPCRSQVKASVPVAFPHVLKVLQWARSSSVCRCQTCLLHTIFSPRLAEITPYTPVAQLTPDTHCSGLNLPLHPWPWPKQRPTLTAVRGRLVGRGDTLTGTRS